MSLEAGQGRCETVSIKYRLINAMNNSDSHFSWKQKTQKKKKNFFLSVDLCQEKLTNTLRKLGVCLRFKPTTVEFTNNSDACQAVRTLYTRGH